MRNFNSKIKLGNKILNESYNENVSKLVCIYIYIYMFACMKLIVYPFITHFPPPPPSIYYFYNFDNLTVPHYSIDMFPSFFFLKKNIQIVSNKRWIFEWVAKFSEKMFVFSFEKNDYSKCLIFLCWKKQNNKEKTNNNR